MGIPARTKAWSAVKVGFLGIILVGLCSLSLGLVSRLVALDPIVFFAAMAGVMMPMVMVTVGGLARWASQNTGLFAEHGRESGAILPSLLAGLMTAAGAAALLLLALAVPLEGAFPPGRFWAYFGSLDVFGYLEIAVLLAAYVALAAIGGVLYGIIVPEEPARDKG